MSITSSHGNRRTVFRPSRKKGGIMIVSMWMTRELITIAPRTPLSEAAAIMNRRHIRRLPVVEYRDPGLFPLGIITSTDILHACPADINPFAVNTPPIVRLSVTAQEIMSRSLRTAAPETPIEDAARILRDGKISTLLVVQKNHLVGLLTESDIFRAFVGILESTGAGARLTFAVPEKEDIFGLLAPVALSLGVRITSLMTVKHDDRRLCVLRISGPKLDDFIDRVWKSGYNVLNVIKYTT